MTTTLGQCDCACGSDRPAVDRLIDINQLAAVLGTNTRMPRRLVYERRIPYVKVGRLVRFRMSDVEEYLAARAVRPERSRALRRKESRGERSDSA